MKYFCSLSDSKYLSQGLCLFDSLLETVDDDFVLYYLCLDEDTYQRMQSHSPLIKPIRLSKLEDRFYSLGRYKNKKPYNEYCWALASTFCYYLLDTLNVPEVLYIDSDIYFYKDPQIIFDELGAKSVGIIRHRHNTKDSPDGEYNVGIVYFRNNEFGKGCLKWWNDAIIDEKYPELQTCGDQKYLERFIPLFGEESVCVLDKTFAHGAPWNFRLYVYDEYHKDGNIIWGDKEQPLVFNHFSRLSYDDSGISPTSGMYADHTLNFGVFQIPVVKQFYIDYVTRLKEYK